MASLSFPVLYVIQRFSGVAFEKNQCIDDDEFALLLALFFLGLLFYLFLLLFFLLRLAAR